MKTSSNYKITGKDFDLLLDLHRGNITVQQKWSYEWVVPSVPSGKTKHSPWTYAEKKAFHHVNDSAVWQWWSHKFKLNVTGSDEYAEKFKGKQLPLNFDVRWVTHGEHYKVIASKGRAPSGKGKGDRVDLATRKIYLFANSADMQHRYRLKSGATSSKPQTLHIPTAHEFGHAIGYHEDEYDHASYNCEDVNSMMNAGWELRGRHIKSVMDKLNDILPDTHFSISKQR